MCRHSRRTLDGSWHRDQGYGSTKSHEYVVSNIIPALTEIGYGQLPTCGQPDNERNSPRTDFNYWWIFDHLYLASYEGYPVPSYPAKGANRYRAGGNINKALRHYINRKDCKDIQGIPLKCDEGAWVLYDDIIGIDNLWCDGENINRASTREDNDKVREIRMKRIGLVVDLTIAEKSSEEQSSVPNSCVEGRK